MRWQSGFDYGPMPATFKQIGALVAMGLNTLPQRTGSSSVVVVGIAGVVAVLVAVLAVADGLGSSLRVNGRSDTVILLSAGSDSETSSAVSRAEYDAVAGMQGVMHGADGKPLVLPEIVSVFTARFKSSAHTGTVSLRGIEAGGFEIHPSVHITDGRAFRPGVREMLVGSGVARQFAGFATGEQVKVGSTLWRVTGHFESHDIHDSEVLADVNTVQSAMDMGGDYSSVYVQLRSADGFPVFRDAVASNPALHLDAQIESEYFAAQSRDMVDTFSGIAYLIGTLMGIGALFGAVHSLYISADARKVEMGTLRAIGFGPGCVTIAFLIEALTLSLVGGCIGGFLAWLSLNGHSTSTSGGGLSQVIFQLHVSPTVIARGLIWACAIGLLGALIPAVRASRQPIVIALQRS